MSKFRSAAICIIGIASILLWAWAIAGELDKGTAKREAKEARMLECCCAGDP